MKPQNKNKNVCVSNMTEKCNKIHILVKKNPRKAKPEKQFSCLWIYVFDKDCIT